MDSDFSARCIARARELSRTYEGIAPPYDLSELLDRYGVYEVIRRPLNVDARLLAKGGGFVIELNSIFPRVRQRLSLAHEIGHLILNECSGQDPCYTGHGDPQSEDLCNHVAGELLVPDWALVNHLNSAPVFEGWEKTLTAATVLGTAAAFEVSVEVMAKRIFRDLCLARDRIAVIWRYAHNRKSSSSVRQLRIAAAWHSIGGTFFVPLNKTVPTNSLVFHTYETGSRTSGREVMDFGHTKREFLVDAAAFPSFSLGGHVPPTRAVLSLLTPT
jgi:Zn-dependent peptidase ImmA (M78 family)